MVDAAKWIKRERERVSLPSCLSDQVAIIIRAFVSRQPDIRVPAHAHTSIYLSTPSPRMVLALARSLESADRAYTDHEKEKESDTASAAQASALA